MRYARLFTTTIAVAVISSSPSFAVGENPADLMRTLPGSKHTLTEVIEKIAKMGELPTAAKFEYEDGALHLAVYSSAKGKRLDAEHNVLKEHKGNPLDAAWKPGVEVFKDVEHVSRAAEYHALMEISPYSLLDIANKARAEGTPVWVVPYVLAGKPVFEAGVQRNGQLTRIRYGLLDGKKM